MRDHSDLLTTIPPNLLRLGLGHDPVELIEVAKHFSQLLARRLVTRILTSIALHTEARHSHHRVVFLSAASEEVLPRDLTLL